jgi:hypothetical protein
MKTYLFHPHAFGIKKSFLITLLFIYTLLLDQKITAQCTQTIFYESFETGSLSPIWVNQGSTNIFTVTSGAAAVGTFKLEGTGSSGHLGGIMATITSATPDYICWYIYPPNGSSATNYVVIGDNSMTTTNCIVFCYWNPTSGGISFASSPSYVYTCSSSQWYKIELKNVNYTLHTFDIWINNTLVQTAFNFRSNTQNNLSKIHLYNFSTGNLSIWDDINMTSSSFAMTAATSSATCFGGSNGSATVATTSTASPITYTWTGSTSTSSTASNLSAGSYTVRMQDANTCTSSVTFSVTQPSAIVPGSIVSNVPCFGGSNGSVTATASGGTGPYSFVWTGSINSPTLGNLSQGTYSFMVTDSHSCTANGTVAVTQPSSAVAAAVAGTNVTCFGLNNGKGKVTASGGTSGYTYTWVPSGGNNITAQSLASGNYTVFVTDANSCTTSAVINITQPASLTATESHTNITCISVGIGEITPSGGTAPYTYTWAPWGGNASTMTLAVGLHYVTIKDVNGCSTTKTLTITQSLTAPDVSVTTSKAAICKGQTVTLTASGNSDSYLWNNGSTTSQITVSPTLITSYTVTGTFSVNGCSTSTTVTQIVVNCSGINSIGNNATFVSAYPNPFSGDLILELNGEAQVVIYNILGEKIVENVLHEGKNQLDLMNLEKGIYLIYVANKNDTEIVKVIHQ